MFKPAISCFVCLLALAALSCNDDSEADSLGVGAECVASDECHQDDSFTQICLTQFAGGYCGLADCIDDLDCPTDSACIAHEDNTNYCFRTCVDKADCNANRIEVNWSNCSSNVTFTDGANGRKACVPPSSGI